MHLIILVRSHACTSVVLRISRCAAEQAPAECAYVPSSAAVGGQLRSRAQLRAYSFYAILVFNANRTSARWPLLHLEGETSGLACSAALRIVSFFTCANLTRQEVSELCGGESEHAGKNMRAFHDRSAPLRSSCHGDTLTSSD